MLERILADGCGEDGEGGQAATAVLTDGQKARMCRRIAQSDKCLADGADEVLQVSDLSCFWA